MEYGIEIDNTQLRAIISCVIVILCQKMSSIKNNTLYIGFCLVILKVVSGATTEHYIRQCASMFPHVNLTCDPGKFIWVTQAVVGYSETWTEYPCPLGQNYMHCIGNISEPADMCNTKTACSMDESIIIKDLQNDCPVTTFIEIKYTCTSSDVTTELPEPGSPSSPQTSTPTVTKIEIYTTPSSKWTQTYAITTTMYTEVLSTTQEDPNGENDGSWMIIIIVVIVVILVGVGVGLAIYFCRKKHIKHKSGRHLQEDKQAASSVAVDRGHTALPPGGYHPDDTLIVDNANYVSILDLKQNTGPIKSPKHVPSAEMTEVIVDTDFEGTDMVDNANYASVRSEVTQSNSAPHKALTSPGLGKELPIPRIPSDFYDTNIVDNATYVSKESAEMVITPADLLKPDKAKQGLPPKPDTASIEEDPPYDDIIDDSEAEDNGYFNSGYDEVTLDLNSKPTIVVKRPVVDYTSKPKILSAKPTLK